MYVSRAPSYMAFISYIFGHLPRPLLHCVACPTVKPLLLYREQAYNLTEALRQVKRAIASTAKSETVEAHSFIDMEKIYDAVLDVM